MNERAMCAMFMAFMTFFCFSPPGSSSPPADSALMFIGILTALQSHDLAESMHGACGWCMVLACIHVYVYSLACTACYVPEFYLHCPLWNCMATPRNGKEAFGAPDKKQAARVVGNR